MKAVQFSRYGDPEVLQVAEAPDPIAGPEEVLIDVKATTVNRLDLFQRAGSRPVPVLPFTPGLEAVGVVVADNQGFQAGERVLTTRAAGAHGGGGYASRIAAPARDLARLPDGVSFEDAAAAGLAASTAWFGLFDVGQIREGERVLIWGGTSGVGSMAIQLAKQAGAWVVTTTSSEARASTLRRLGADMVVNYKEQSVSQVVRSVNGVNLVLELIGATLQESIDACAPEGRVILIGNLGGQKATVDTQSWRLKRVTVVGPGIMHTTPENEGQILKMVAQQTIIPLIHEVLPVEKAAEAHRKLANQEVVGKMVLVHGK
ncbi:MAG TPA: zinc-binding dehydrogenase [Ktedonobacteraceae bacterium]|nr:zinc-binding dehydrogenase [Ktedonobacteraceae bacterium]